MNPVQFKEHVTKEMRRHCAAIARATHQQSSDGQGVPSYPALWDTQLAYMETCFDVKDYFAVEQFFGFIAAHCFHASKQGGGPFTTTVRGSVVAAVETEAERTRRVHLPLVVEEDV